MPEYNNPQSCGWCWIGYEKHGGRYNQRGYSLNTETCVRRCIGKRFREGRWVKVLNEAD